MLEACRPFGDNGHVKMCLNEAIPQWCMGEQITSLHEAIMIKWCIPACMELEAL